MANFAVKYKNIVGDQYEIDNLMQFKQIIIQFSSSYLTFHSLSFN